jgi:predicted nucleic acid-binding protein
LKEVLVDTNVLVSFVFDREPEQQEQADELLRLAASGRLRVLLHQVVLTEMAWVLLNLYDVPPAEVRATLGDLLSLPGTVPVHELSWVRVLDLWPNQVRDLGDAAIAAVALQTHADAVATFDRPFRRRLKSLRLASYW